LYIVKALESVASIGKIKARRIMADLKITEKRRIESLSSQEREELLKRIKALV
jgi:ribosomal protein S13